MYIKMDNTFVLLVIRYLDYEMHLKESGKAYADERRKAYKSRHEKDRKVLRSVGYYADKILW